LIVRRELVPLFTLVCQSNLACVKTGVFGPFWIEHILDENYDKKD
jgi:hypothetical protein